MQNDKVRLLQAVSDDLLKNNIHAAKEKIDSRWAFERLNNVKRQAVPKQKQAEMFLRDNFTCRYCGTKAIFKGALRMISESLPQSFPFHPNWKVSESHMSYWWLTSSVDHLVPVARGGSNKLDNLVTACYRCNDMKPQWLTEEIGWELLEPSQEEWDGLVHVFRELMHRRLQQDTAIVQENALREWLKVWDGHYPD